MKNLLVLIISLLLPAFAVASEAEPDLRTLSMSGQIMGPGSYTYPVSQEWAETARVMKYVDVFDNIVDEIAAVVCSQDNNKSVLVIGEPSEFYRYIFARVAMKAGSACANTWHVEININKIEAGHKYVGDVEAYWNDYVLSPALQKNVVLYFSSIEHLIGIGSHMNDDTGIEKEYVSNFTSGKIRTVSFIDKYEYNNTIRSRHAYVLESFAHKVILPPVEMSQAYQILMTYLKSEYPYLEVGEKEMNYLLKTIAYYQPNRGEPARSMDVLKKLIKTVSDKAAKTINYDRSDLATKHPYDPNANQEFIVDYPDAKELQLNFENFDMERSYDVLKITDARTGKLLDTFDGNKGSFKTSFYPTNKLKLNFTSDNGGQLYGFSINKVTTRHYEVYKFKMEEVRKAVLELAQVPAWMINRDYKVIKELKAKLDGDVVGVEDGKADLVRLAKSGYVAGRTDDKPVGTIMFAGPTGTGKSYIAKKAAEFMEMRLITMDMTSYKDPSSFTAFQEVMARNLTNTPYAFYLFEEIDKASIEVLDQLYFMMDEGIFYDRYQRPLFARGAFIMMTTNAASDLILQQKDNPDLKALVMEELGKSFRMSFLNRFDAISVFKPFTDAEYRKLAETMVLKKMDRIKEFFDWTLKVDAGSIDFIGRFGKSDKFGARPMERLVENVIGTGIAEYQMQIGNIEPLSKIDVKKLQPQNQFSIKVNTSAALNYEVDPDANNGLSFINNLNMTKLKHFFDEIRMYND